MKFYLILIILFFSSYGSAQQDSTSEFRAAEYTGWKVLQVQYKLKAVQLLDDYILLSGDSIQRANVTDDFIIIQSRILGYGLQQIRYGKIGKKMNVIERDKLHHIFSESFLRALINRDRYYYEEVPLARERK